MQEKTCIKCGETKPLSAFKNRPGSRDGRRNDCRACSWKREEERRRDPRVRELANRRQRERRKRNYDPIQMRDENLRWRFGFGIEGYEFLLSAQGGVCAICGSDNGGKHLAVDHDHSCCASKKTCGNCVRGLLCDMCNKGIGCLGDDTKRLRAAIKYLEVV